MRSKRGVFARRRQGAAAGVILLIGVTVAGCTGASSSSSGLSSGLSSGADSSGANGLAAAAPAASAPPTQAAASAAYASGQQLIETAQLTVRASSVSGAVSRATSIVRDTGGYVSAENATSGQGHAGKAAATVTFKIPVAVYSQALAELSGSAVGTQVSLTQQAQDVTQQVADVGSRVASDQAAIAQLRALLQKAGSVSELLSVQDQINSEESDLESMLAQQSALDHETAYATVTVTVEGPAATATHAKAAAPPGLFGGAVRGWHAFRVTFSWLLTVLGVVAPFAAVIVIFGAAVWWGRRAARRAGRPAGPAD